MPFYMWRLIFEVSIDMPAIAIFIHMASDNWFGDDGDDDNDATDR